MYFVLLYRYMLYVAQWVSNTIMYFYQTKYYVLTVSGADHAV